MREEGEQGSRMDVMDKEKEGAVLFVLVCSDVIESCITGALLCVFQRRE